MMPILVVVLGAGRGRGGVGPALQELEEQAAGGFVWLVEQPFIDHEEGERPYLRRNLSLPPALSRPAAQAEHLRL